MRFTTRLILTATLLALSATTASAGPIRGLVQRLTGRGGCGSCGQPAAVQYQPATQPPPALVMPQTGTLTLVSHGTSYAPPVVTSGPEYTPIRMGGVVLPTTCSGGGCK